MTRRIHVGLGELHNLFVPIVLLLQPNIAVKLLLKLGALFF